MTLTPMTTRRTLEIAAFCAALLIAALAFHAWLAAHDDQLRLSATLATQKQAIDAADTRERDRSATLKDALAQIDTLKRQAQTQTPAQLARALQGALQLPQPITIASTPNTPSPSAGAASSLIGARDGLTAGASPAPLPSAMRQQRSGTSPPEANSVPASPANPTRIAPQSAAEIPATDLAPLYDYVQDCRACQLQLTAAKQNATDDAAKIHALTRERDAAVTAAKGGSFWLRLKRNAHWLAIGAAVGAITSTAALCNTGHCRK
jgi:hypothetical protein